MAGKDLRAKIRLEGDPKDANAAIKSVDKRFKRLGKTISKVSIGQVAAIAGVVIAFRGLVRGIKSVVDAANVQEDAINALDGALADLGPRADAISEALQRQATALQRTSKFGDENIIQAQALIASFVKEEDAIKLATKATLDLAEAKGFDLTAAADLISKTLGSSTNALTRYGIEVTGAVGSTERLTSLTTNIAKVFGGRATKATETFSGKVKQLSNTFGDLQEEIGFAITRSDDIGKSIDDLRGNVEDLTPQMAELASSIVEVTTSMVNGLVTFGKYIGDLIVLVDGTGDLAKANEDTATSNTALEETAFRLRITVEELELRMKGAVVETRALGIAAREAAEGIDKAGDEAKDTADELKKLEEAAQESADAMISLGDALDIVTASELEKEILDIEDALEKAREATGGFGDEFRRAERIAGEKIDALRDRIVFLRDGLGDAAEAAKETADELLGLGTTSEQTGRKLNGMTTALRGQATQAESTTRALVTLSAVSEQLALAQARTDLAATQAARGRITGVSSQRGEVGAFTGLPVGGGTRQTFRVNPDGSLTRIS